MPPPAPEPAKQPDIAQEREKKKQELAERRREELAQQKKIEEREEREREKKLEARKKQEEAKREQLAKEHAAQERKEREEQAKAAKAAKAAKEKAKEQADAKRLAADREKNLQHLRDLAGKGAPNAPGDAERSSGPSSSYAGRIAARIKPNIVFTDVTSGNPAALVEIRVAPDGTIVGKRLLESSGVRSWDDAVLRAIDKTEVLPRDTDGRVVPRFQIRFRPRD